MPYTGHAPVFFTTAGTIKEQKVVLGLSVLIQQDLGHILAVEWAIVRQWYSCESGECGKDIEGTNHFGRAAKRIDFSFPIGEGWFSYSALLNTSTPIENKYE